MEKINIRKYLQNKIRCFKEWLNYINIIPCPKCGSRENTVFVPVVHVDYIVCEAEMRCRKCGALVNYWATGYETNDSYYSELIAHRFSNLWYNIRNNKILKWRK